MQPKSGEEASTLKQASRNVKPMLKRTLENPRLVHLLNGPFEDASRITVGALRGIAWLDLSNANKTPAYAA